MKFSLSPITVLLALLLLAGCGIVRGNHDVIRSYVLEMEGGDAREESRIPADTSILPNMLVGVPEPAPGFESSQMAYIQIPHEVNYFALSQWVEAPARMLRPLLVRRLEQSGLWRSVIAMPTSVRGDYRLDLTHVVLVQEFLQQPSHVRLEWRGQLLNLNDRQVIGTRNFSREEQTLTEDAYGGVLAAQQAVNHLLNDLMEWLAGCLPGPSYAHC